MQAPVSLAKGGNVSLSKEAPGLKKITVGLGWKPRATSGYDWDLDASVFMLAAHGRVRDNNCFIFYNKLTSDDGSIRHMGDERVGGSGVDDEQIQVDLDTVPDWVDKLAFVVTIHEGDLRRQNFGGVGDAFIRIVDAENPDREISRYDLSEDASPETAMIFGEVYRHNGEWKFRAVGQGFKGGLGPLARSFGVGIA